MARPRQKFQDCVLIVYRYITGEDEGSAFRRFFPYLNGENGISLDALTACLKDAGYMLTAIELSESPDTNLEFLRHFQGKVVMFYIPDNKPIAHAVLVCAGKVFDPAPSSPEEGEFIDEYFERIGGEIRIKGLSKVSRTSPQPAWSCSGGDIP
jgi:hypothetical protein